MKQALTEVKDEVYSAVFKICINWFWTLSLQTFLQFLLKTWIAM